MTKKATLNLDDGAMRLVGKNETGNVTAFDVTSENGGNGSAASPMEVFLQSAAACSGMDILSIIRKKRKTVTDLRIEIEGERAEEHPHIYTSIAVKYILVSPDATEGDLTRACELSQDQYCSAFAMIKRSGCAVSWTSEIERP
jgi:putative redox protein